MHSRLLEGARRTSCWLGLWLILIASGGLAAGGVDSAPAPAVEASPNKSLELILAGAAPMGVDDLKAMQEHVRKLTEQLIKCTVGVTVGQAQGSGVIVSKDGYVLTAAHVAAQPKLGVTFIMSDGKKMTGKTLGMNRTIDSGLMKIEGATDLPFAEMGVSDTLKEGQWCLATGHPGGYQDDRKPVLRLGRILLAQTGVITTDCTLVGGDSGGPLFDLQGKVIGINSRIADRLDTNMHVPIGTFKDTWDRLVKAEAWGSMLPGKEASLGVRCEPDFPGAKIASIVPGSAAERTDLKVGDVIVKMGKDDVTDFRSLSDAVTRYQAGAWVQVTVKRGDETVVVPVIMGRKRP